ncbi:MAG: CPBP family intramembrane glutamic endopeptidase [Ferruginibacter sp.]
MQYKSVKGFSPAGQFGILVLFLGLGFILAAVVQLVIGMKMVPDGTPLANMGDVMMKAMMDPKNIFMARVSQVLGTFFLLCLPALLYLLVVHGRNSWWLGFNKYINAKQILFGFLIMFTANILAAPLADISKSIIAHFPDLNATARRLEDMYNEQVMALSNLKSWPEFLMAIVIMAFFPAMFEEMLFRGAMQNVLIRWWKNPMLAIVVTSILFSIIHFSIYLFLSRAVLGFVLGMLYYRTKNIWINIVAHFLNNLIAVIQLFYLGMKNEKLDVSKLDPSIHWGWGIVALAALIFLFWMLNKASADNRLRIETRETLLLEQADPFGSIANENF